MMTQQNETQKLGSSYSHCLGPDPKPAFKRGLEPSDGDLYTDSTPLFWAPNSPSTNLHQLGHARNALPLAAGTGQWLSPRISHTAGASRCRTIGFRVLRGAAAVSLKPESAHCLRDEFLRPLCCCPTRYVCFVNKVAESKLRDVCVMAPLGTAGSGDEELIDHDAVLFVTE